MRDSADFSPKQREVNAWLAALGRPERGKLIVHVVGTNGKGSTGRAIALALEKATGQEVGHFLSPHVHRYEERILLNSQPISAARLAAVREEMAGAAETPLPKLPYFTRSFVEAMTAYRHTPIVVMEAGIGGALDATNIVPTAINVFATIDYDHQNYLGNTLTEIAANKAGVMHAGIPGVSTWQQPEAARVLEMAARDTGAPLAWVLPKMASEAKLAWQEGLPPTLTFDYHRTLPGGEPSLLSGTYQAGMIGAHQVQNFTTALRALEVLFDPSFEKSPEAAPLLADASAGFSLGTAPARTPLLVDASVGSAVGTNPEAAPAAQRPALFPSGRPSDDALRRAAQEAIREAYLPGRLELVSTDPLLLLDGAHNPQAVDVLLSNLQALSALAPARGKKRVLVFGMHDGKIPPEKREALFAAFDAVYETPVEGATDDAIEKGVEAQLNQAFAAYPDAFFVVTGSLYLLHGAACWLHRHRKTRGGHSE